ncbi:MAG: hypothetical protein SF002_03800 [Alphaproteobacteria bacterium]|nr:hypothetical protein [Alphaproteobacteria bacterium]
MMRVMLLAALLWSAAAGAWAWFDVDRRTPTPAQPTAQELERRCAARSYYTRPDCVEALMAERRAAAREEALALAAPGYGALIGGPAFGLLALGLAIRVLRRRRPPADQPPAAEDTPLPATEPAVRVDPELR